MSATSINIQPAKKGSEAHNNREKDLSYVRKELTPSNESWQIDTISNRLEKIKETYQMTTGQSLQKKATPIREGVVVIRDETTMSQLHSFTRKAEERFGIKAIQIHIHKDEGHGNNNEWKPNLHAHIVFDWTQSNGKTCKLNKHDMSDLQTLLSLSLEMERGKSSDIKHLSAIQFKNEREKAKSFELTQEIKKLETTKNVKSAVSKTVERFKDVLGRSTNDKEKDSLIASNTILTKEIKQVQLELNQVKASLVEEQNKSTWNIQRANKAETSLSDHKNYIRTIQKELSHFGKLFNDTQKEFIKAHFPNVAKLIDTPEIKQKQSNSHKL